MNPTARPPLPSDPAPWLLGPAEISAIRADDNLLDRVARGELPDANDPTRSPRLAASHGSITAGGAR